jgi:hypothetical protein
MGQVVVEGDDIQAPPAAARRTELELRMTRRALVELYEFIVAELDPDPAPIEHYFASAVYRRTARRAVNAVESTGVGG